MENSQNSWALADVARVLHSIWLNSPPNPSAPPYPNFGAGHTKFKIGSDTYLKVAFFVSTIDYVPERHGYILFWKDSQVFFEPSRFGSFSECLENVKVTMLKLANIALNQQLELVRRDEK